MNVACRIENAYGLTLCGESYLYALRPTMWGWKESKRIKQNTVTLARLTKMLTCTQSEFGYDSHEDSNILDRIQLLWYIFYNPNENFTDSCATTFDGWVFLPKMEYYFMCACVSSLIPEYTTDTLRAALETEETEVMNATNISSRITTSAAQTMNKNILWFMHVVWFWLFSTLENMYSYFFYAFWAVNSLLPLATVSTIILKKIRWQKWCRMRTRLTKSERKMWFLI